MDMKENLHPLWDRNCRSKPLPKTPTAESDLHEINFSRKREPSSPLLPKHNSSKRHRPSKFQEGSFSDKPSQIPPNFYARAMQSSLHIPSASTSTNNSNSTTSGGFEDLMESYHSFTHHPNPSVATQLTAATSASIQSKDSTSIKLGHSLNPLKLWKKMKARKSQVEMRLDPDVDRDLDHELELQNRQIRAEQAYALFKATANRNASVTIRSPIRQSKLPPLPSSPDQSTPKRVSAIPGKPSISNLFHIRSPSLHELKRMASDSTISRRSAYIASHNIHLEKSPVSSPSIKKNIVKTEKLSRRVSNLEGQLELARRKLELAQNENEQQLAKEKEIQQLAKAKAKEIQQLQKTSKSLKHSTKQIKGNHKFKPLPRLVSESLLTAGNDSTNLTTLKPLPHIQTEPTREDPWFNLPLKSSHVDYTLQPPPSPTRSAPSPPSPPSRPSRTKSTSATVISSPPAYILATPQIYASSEDMIDTGIAPAALSKVPLKSPPLRPTAFATPADMPNRTSSKKKSLERLQQGVSIDQLIHSDLKRDQEAKKIKICRPQAEKPPVNQAFKDESSSSNQKSSNQRSSNESALESLEEEFEWPDDVF